MTEEIKIEKVETKPESVEDVPVEKKDWIAEGILWYATPKALRDPKTATTFCKLYGVDRSTFYYEMSKKDNREKIVDLCLEQAKKWTPDIVDKLKQKAMDGDSSSIAMFFDYILQIKKKLELSGDKNSPLSINLVSYANNDTKPLPAEGLPVADPKGD